MYGNDKRPVNDNWRTNDNNPAKELRSFLRRGILLYLVFVAILTGAVFVGWWYFVKTVKESQVTLSTSTEFAHLRQIFDNRNKGFLLTLRDGKKIEQIQKKIDDTVRLTKFIDPKNLQMEGSGGQTAKMLDEYSRLQCEIVKIVTSSSDPTLGLTVEQRKNIETNNKLAETYNLGSNKRIELERLAFNKSVMAERKFYLTRFGEPVYKFPACTN